MQNVAAGVMHLLRAGMFLDLVRREARGKSKGGAPPTQGALPRRGVRDLV